jgi:WD40 repeat protein
VKVWDTQTGQELLTLKGGGSTVVFSPDGKRLASYSGETAQEVNLWDAQTGQELPTLKAGPTSNFLSVAFSPDSKRPPSRTKPNWTTGLMLLRRRLRSMSFGPPCKTASGSEQSPNDGGQQRCISSGDVRCPPSCRFLVPDCVRIGGHPRLLIA